MGGGPLAGNFGAEWNIIIGYTLTKAVIFDGVTNQVLANGRPLGPVSNIGGICCRVTTSPIFNGPQFYNPGGGTLPAGPHRSASVKSIPLLAFKNARISSGMVTVMD